MCSTVILTETAIIIILLTAATFLCIKVDATKAFDKVNYGKLFRCLGDRKIFGVISSFLIYLSSSHIARVIRNGARGLLLLLLHVSNKRAQPAGRLWSKPTWYSAGVLGRSPPDPSSPTYDLGKLIY